MKNLRIKIKATNFKTKLVLVAIVCVMVASVLTGIVLAAGQVHIIDGKAELTVYGDYNDIPKLFAENDIVLGADDKYTVENVQGAIIIKVKRAQKVKVSADKKTTEVLIYDGTRKEALDAAGIVLNKDDIVNFTEDAMVSSDDHIVVNRLKYKVSTVKRKIKYDTVVKKAPDLYTDEKKVIKKGSYGAATIEYKTTIIDGVVLRKGVTSKKVTAKSKEQIVLVGTKKRPKPNAVSAIKPPGKIKLKNGVPLNYSKVLTGKATAYCIPNGTTSTGKKVRVGYVAVDPKVIPYGTRLYIKTSTGSYVYGYAVAEDTGGAMRSGRILVDLYMSSIAACRSFGVRTVDIYVLN